MDIKNLKINSKAVSKLTACVLVVALTAQLSGCSDSRRSLLEGTILERTCVVTFEDGSKDVAQIVGRCDNTSYNDYCSIITGKYYGSKDCTDDKYSGNIVYHYGITSEENIASYLTTDELTKAIQGKLDNNDIIAIISRAIEPTAEETTTKTR